jgi:hypothetical protein
MTAEDTDPGAASRRALRPSDLGTRAGSTGRSVPPTPSRPFSPSIQVRGSGDFRAGIHRLSKRRQLKVRPDYLRGLLDGLGIEPARVRQLPVLSPEKFDQVKARVEEIRVARRK